MQYETDRARFLGRGRELRDALSIVDARPLSNTAGTVLDPVFSLRRRVRVAPGETAHVAFWTIVTASREQAVALADKHRDTAVFERAKTLAWTQAQVQLRYLGVDFDEAQDFQRIANRVLYADAALRAGRDILARNRSSAAGLWPYGVSGDLPIVLVRIDDEHDLEFVKQLLRAHEYWRTKRLAVDLVILNERPPSYASDLQQGLDAAIRTSQARPGPSPADDGPGRGAVFVLRSDLMTESSVELLQTAARVVLVARRGTLADQLARLPEPEPLPAPASGRWPPAAVPGRSVPCHRWSSTTAWAASPRAVANTSRCWTRVSGRRRRGSTSSPIRNSASSCRRTARAARGRQMRARIRSRRGPMIRWRIHPPR